MSPRTQISVDGNTSQLLSQNPWSHVSPSLTCHVCYQQIRVALPSLYKYVPSPAILLVTAPSPVTSPSSLTRVTAKGCLTSLLLSLLLTLLCPFWFSEMPDKNRNSFLHYGITVRKCKMYDLSAFLLDWNIIHLRETYMCGHQFSCAYLCSSF